MSPSIDPRFNTAGWTSDGAGDNVGASSSKIMEREVERLEDDDDLNESANGDEGESEGHAAEDNGNDIPGKIVKPLSAEALAEFEKAQQRAGVIYISRIPPGMKPTKVRHLLSQHGEIGRVYLKQEDPKRAYLRRKHTSTKKVHYTEGWVEFTSKRIARSVAEMLNAQPVGGKKGSRFRDDIWTMKYLPRFKWNMLTEQISHEAATHAAKLRVELSQSRNEQRDYLKNVELARVLEKRAKRKRDAGTEPVETDSLLKPKPTRPSEHSNIGREDQPHRKKSRNRPEAVNNSQADQALDGVLHSLF